MSTTRADLNSGPARLPELPRLPVPPGAISQAIPSSIAPLLLQSSGSDSRRNTSVVKFGLLNSVPRRPRITPSCQFNWWILLKHDRDIPAADLTGLDRDRWTDAREHLLSLDSTVNRDSLSLRVSVRASATPPSKLPVTIQKTLGGRNSNGSPIKESHIHSRSKSTVEAISKDSDCDLLIFDKYGTDYIKRSVRHSPDAYIQMAIQLAWFRQRELRVGKAMDSEEDCHLIYNLFIQAISAHNSYTKKASLGRAFDRHFLGLRLQHRHSEDGTLPELFTDPVFAESRNGS
ncbi:hypothetical protein H4Q26_011240 [Puccinia striiformis f. sp. tritici PST-130]|nr:hypothetical protein H4Q26_011240 [Puccinia striiformis f. sp. tritici PST-130]